MADYDDYLLSKSNSLRIVALRIQLNEAIYFCQLARRMSSERRRKSIKAARKVFDAVEKQIFKLRMGDKEFDQLTAVYERLKLDLERFEAEA
jgi:hypothetical protein